MRFPLYRQAFLSALEFGHGCALWYNGECICFCTFIGALQRQFYTISTHILATAGIRHGVMLACCQCIALTVLDRYFWFLDFTVICVCTLGQLHAGHTIHFVLCCRITTHGTSFFRHTVLAPCSRRGVPLVGMRFLFDHLTGRQAQTAFGAIYVTAISLCGAGSCLCVLRSCLAVVAFWIHAYCDFLAIQCNRIIFFIECIVHIIRQR